MPLLNSIVSVLMVSLVSAPSAGSIEAIDYMTTMKLEHDINIVASNNSWGGAGYSRALKDAIQNSKDAGIMFVAAAGNEDLNNDIVSFYPASYDLDGIISVAAPTIDGDYASGVFIVWN